jgi:hypothetical protein
MSLPFQRSHEPARRLDAWLSVTSARANLRRAAGRKRSLFVHIAVRRR